MNLFKLKADIADANVRAILAPDATTMATWYGIAADRQRALRFFIAKQRRLRH